MTLGPITFTVLAWGAVALVLLVFLYVIYTVVSETDLFRAVST